MPQWVWKLLIALLLDIIFGDPQAFPHPVRFIGKYVQFCEIRIRHLLPSAEFFAGIFCGLSTVILSFSVVYFSLKIASYLNGTLCLALEIYWIYAGLCAGDLHRSVEKVFYALYNKNIPKARKYLSLIVGRDTEHLDEIEISRAAVETTAESLLDGLLSPLFYFLLGGAPLMWAYKAINTCDSMIGHKDEKYFYFGKFSAKLDDIANFAPARLSIPIIFLATVFLRLIEGRRFQPIQSLLIALRDGPKHASPNAGIPEAAFAGALSVRLGGVNFYEGKKYETPIINPRGEICCYQDIWSSLKLMWASYLLAIFIICLIGLAFGNFFPLLQF